jgi:putative modified peptide
LKLTQDQALEFLERLGNDDEFRDRVASNPRKTLREYGITFGPGQLPAKVELPEKEHLREVVRGVAEQTEKVATWWPGIVFAVFLRRRAKMS